MNSLHGQRLLVISCKGVLNALYMERIQPADLDGALFYLDCPKQDIFRDCGDINALLNSYGDHEGVVNSYRIVRNAVKRAKQERRVAWRSPRNDNWEQLNRLLSVNHGPKIGQFCGLPYTPHNVVLSALSAETPYFIVWEKLLEKV